MDQPKKLSVCMLAYNTSAFITRAIESVLMQETNFEIELLISDNNSTDGTKDIIKQYQEKYPAVVKAVFNSTNIGMSANFVNTFKRCSGEYIAVLDSDDFWCDPLKLQKQVDFLDANRQYGVCYTDCYIVNDNGDKINWDEMDYYRSQFVSGDIFFNLLREAAFIPNLTTCFRKELIKDALEKEDLWYFEDWWMWLYISSSSKFYYYNAVTSCYRRHDNNISETRVAGKELWLNYKKKSYAIYSNVILHFNKVNTRKLTNYENQLIFRRILMLLYRKQKDFTIKLRIFLLVFKYFPGHKFFMNLLYQKIRRKSMKFFFIPSYSIDYLIDYLLAGDIQLLAV